MSIHSRTSKPVITPNIRNSSLAPFTPAIRTRRFSVTLRFQSNLARADRLAKWRGKLVDHRLYLQHQPRFPDESRSLHQQWNRPRSVWLRRFQLHLSSLGQGWREGAREK